MVSLGLPVPIFVDYSCIRQFPRCVPFTECSSGGCIIPKAGVLIASVKLLISYNTTLEISHSIGVLGLIRICRTGPSQISLAWNVENSVARKVRYVCTNVLVNEVL